MASNLNNTSAAGSQSTTAPPFFAEFPAATTRRVDADDYSVDIMEFKAGNDAVKFSSMAPPSSSLPTSYFSNPPMAFSSPADPFSSSFPLSPGFFANLNCSPENTSPYPHAFLQTNQATHAATLHPTTRSWSSNTHDQELNMDSGVKLEFPSSSSSSFYASSSGCINQAAAPVGQPRRSDGDGYCWRKYGQKQVKGSDDMRNYYRCTSPDCPMRKKVETASDGQVTAIVYKGDHNHPKPANSRRKNSAFNSSPASASPPDHLLQPENPSVISFGQSNRSDGRFDRRGEEEEEEEMAAASSSQTVREPKVVVQTMSNVDILPDGYRWRKYGQKVVKGNLNPRSYYKCTSASCHVRKHIERSSHDFRMVITTYEGKHNHDIPAARGSRINEIGRPQAGSSSSSSSTASTARPSALPANWYFNQTTPNNSAPLDERQTASAWDGSSSGNRQSSHPMNVQQK